MMKLDETAPKHLFNIIIYGIYAFLNIFLVGETKQEL